jgi:hypothetical protein
MVSRVMGSLGLGSWDWILTLLEPSIARGKWRKQFAAPKAGRGR